MLKRSAVTSAGVVALLSLVLVACGSPSAPTVGPTPSATGSSSEPETLVDFIWAAAGLPATTDPHDGGPLPGVLGAERGSKPIAYDVENVAGHGCEALAPITALKGDLLESWQLSADGSTLTLRIRQGVLSSFGNELTSADFEWSFNRGMELSPAIKRLLETITFWDTANPFTVVDSHTIDIHIGTPGALDVVAFTMFSWTIFDSVEAVKHVTADDPWAKEWLGKNSADFGPWMFTEDDWESGAQITMERNPNYYAPDQLGNIGRLIMRVIPDASTRAQLVSRGEADYADRLTSGDYKQLEASGAQVLNCVSSDRDTLVLNFADERLADVKVRQAISLAIDRGEVNQAAYTGLASPSTDGLSQVYDFEAASPDDRIQYDVDRAKALLAEAGYPDGFDLELTLSPTRPGPQAEQIGINLQSQLAKVGIKLSIKLIPSATQFQTAFLEGQYQAIVYQEPPAIADPAYAAGLYNLCNGFQNSFGYCNEEYDELQARILATSPGAERSDYMRQLSALVVETQPVIYLLDTGQPRAFSASVDTATYRHLPYATTVWVAGLTKKNS